MYTYLDPRRTLSLTKKEIVKYGYDSCVFWFCEQLPATCAKRTILYNCPTYASAGWWQKNEGLFHDEMKGYEREWRIEIEQ